MRLIVCKDLGELGVLSAAHAERIINEAIAKKGRARILLSTGASQFPFFERFVNCNIDWAKVEMFHLDEYVGMAPSHPASFNLYLRERFVDRVALGKYHLIDGTQNTNETISALTLLLNEAPIDLGMIGIGENAHIAFNDPPADFDDKSAYKVVTLADRCLDQQIGEGWFKNREECFKQAISMTCHRIMQCEHIISVVPYKVKAEAIYNTFVSDVTQEIPATLMKKHSDVTVYVDPDSAALLDKETIKAYS